MKTMSEPRLNRLKMKKSEPRFIGLKDYHDE
jgi:hypothetical protein